MAAMRAIYRALGASNLVATYLLNEEGLDSCEELSELVDEGCIQLCKTIRNPGGNAPGHIVSNRVQMRLTQAAQYCRMQMRVSRPLVPANIRPGVVLQTAQLQLEQEDKHRNDDALFFPLENKSVKDHMFQTQTDKWVEQLDNRRNSQKVPVSYVLRPNLLVVPHADDPVNNYTTHLKECVARMQIIQAGCEGEPLADLEKDKATNWTTQANVDNGDAYDMHEKSFMSTRYWIHVTKTIQVRRDGRAALAAMKEGVLGPDAQDARSRKNKVGMEKTYYYGEKVHSNWGTYVLKRTEIHNVQETLALESPERFSAF